MKWKVYWAIWVGVYLCIWGFGYLAKKNMTQAKIDNLIYGRSELLNSENPCASNLSGNPTQPDKLQIRVNFYCKNGSVGLNTLAFTPLRDKTVAGVISETGRIEGFAELDEHKWRCNSSSRAIENWSEVVTPGNWIECYEI